MDSSTEASLRKEGNTLCWSLKASESGPELGDCFLPQVQPLFSLGQRSRDWLSGNIGRLTRSLCGKYASCQVAAACVFDPSTPESEAGGSL